MPADPYLRAFGRKVAARRKDHGWTQEELATKSGLTAKYVSEIERGITNASLTVLRKLAHGFGTTTSELLSGESLDAAREVQAVLSTREPGEQEMVLRIVRAMFGPTHRSR